MVTQSCGIDIFVVLMLDIYFNKLYAIFTFLNKLTKRQKNSCGDAVFRCITCLTLYHNGIGLLWKLL